MKLTDHLKEIVPKDKALHIYENMLGIRRMEEVSARLYTEEKIRGFLHLYIGQEAIASTIIPLLEKKDQIFATYREHAHAFVRGISFKKIFAEMFGKVTGCSRGRGGSMHLFDTRLAFYGGNAIVASHLPVAAGIALANKFKMNNLISVCFFGEGAISEGAFHETMNIAQTWKLPILFICENNYYAMGTSLERSQSQVNLTTRAKSYNIESQRVNGMSISDLFEVGQTAVKYVRDNKKPFFLECDTYRFSAHSMFDPELYRSKEEVNRWKKNDPLIIYTKMLKDLNWIDDHIINDINSRIEKNISEAIEFAQNSDEETFEEAIKDFITKEQSVENDLPTSSS